MSQNTYQSFLLFLKRFHIYLTMILYKKDFIHTYLPRQWLPRKLSAQWEKPKNSSDGLKNSYTCTDIFYWTCYENFGHYTTSRPGLTITKIFKLQYSDDLRFSDSGASDLNKAPYLEYQTWCTDLRRNTIVPYHGIRRKHNSTYHFVMKF